MKSPTKTEIMWFNVEDALPAQFKAVLVAGGIAFREGDYWRTLMEVKQPRIEWKVIWWAFLPDPPAQTEQL